MFLPSHNVPTRWVKGVPIKINIFTWRARRDCLPTRLNLIQRGISLESVSCPICCASEEDVSHVFFSMLVGSSDFKAYLQMVGGCLATVFFVLGVACLVLRYSAPI